MNSKPFKREKALTKRSAFSCGRWIFRGPLQVASGVQPFLDFAAAAKFSEYQDLPLPLPKLSVVSAAVLAPDCPIMKKWIIFLFAALSTPLRS